MGSPAACDRSQRPHGHRHRPGRLHTPLRRVSGRVLSHNLIFDSAHAHPRRFTERELGFKSECRDVIYPFFWHLFKAETMRTLA